MPEEKSLLPRPPKALYNWVSLTGAVFAVGSIFAFALLFALEVFLPYSNPYVGLLVYLISPICFFIGIALVVIGVWAQKFKVVSERVQIDLSRTHDRKVLVGFALGTLVFLLATAFGSYQTYQFTDSVQFCGASCHLPMHPEFTAYLHSPHARVACVDCHVGAGIDSYVRSKLNGMHQLFDVVTNQIPKPIATPVKNLRPARDTCEKCHWPERFIGTIVRDFPHFLTDDTNTPFTVRLMLKVGGGGENGPASGIHWHVSRNEKVEYIATDVQRQTIPWVRVTDLATGKVTVFKTAKFTDDPATHTIRTMDCIDCHTRPSHQFLSPNEAVDEAITHGQLDRSVPKMKFNVVTALTGSYQTTAEAMDKIASSLHAAYPALSGVDTMIAAAQQIYRDNFFPEMKTDWRVHPDNIGHKDSPGCFRCHDGDHVAEDGKTSIPADNCNICHVILSQGSGDQLKQLNADGVDFYHIDSTYLDFSCASCHTGTIQK